MKNLKISSKLYLLLFCFLAGFVVFGVFAKYTLDTLRVNGPIYHEIISNKDVLADILPPPLYILESYLVVHEAFDAKPDEIKSLKGKFATLIKEYNERRVYWQKELKDEKLKGLVVVEACRQADEFFNVAENDFFPALESGDKVKAQAVTGKLSKLYLKHRSVIDEAVKLATTRSEVYENTAARIIFTRSWVLLVIGIVIIVLSSILCIAIITRLLGELGADPAEVKDLAGRVAAGDVSMAIDLSGKRGDSLLAAMNRMVKTIKTLVADISMLSRASVEGNLAFRVDASKHQGDFRKIVQGINDTQNAVVGPLRVAADFVALISKGEMPPPIAESFSGDFNILKNNLNILVATLIRIREEDRQRDWLKNGVNELNTLIRGEQRTAEMADKVLKFFAEYLKAGAGAFYVYDDRGQALALAATYAFTPRKNQGDRFRLGEGLIGQAALEKKMLCLADIPPDYLQIGSALGEAAPKNIVALPLVHDEKLVGAMELGTFKPFDHNELELLNQAMGGIAIELGVSHSRQRINELFEQTQQQTEELRVQQEEMQQTNEELEERAEMLEQQRRLIQAKNQEIERASAYKSEFLANMSHELRTPLNSIMILSGLLMENKEGNLRDKQKEFAATIKGAGEDLLNLINDILDLSKVEAGHLDLRYEEVPVRAFCDTLEAMFRPLAGQKKLEFSICVDAYMPQSMRIDGQRTLQILKNLLSNAFKFTEKGSVALSLSAPAGTASPLHVPSLALSVRDTGIGIPADKRDLVFQAFQQAEGGANRKFSGTGLGLSISLQLALRMGGDLTLESEPGKGSVFTLYLPMAGSEASQPGPVKVPPQPSTAEGAERPSAEESAGLVELPRPLADDRDKLQKGIKSILVIEDDLNFAKVLMGMVRDKGFGCIVAADGTSGVHLADLYQPSAIILDVVLPGLDGWGVMQGLKDNPATRHIPVHFITCLDERQRAMAMGAIGFITKPVSPEQLDEVFATIEENNAKKIRRLLIIEDNPGEVEGIVNLLPHGNLEIQVTSSAGEAVNLLDRSPADCIVLDIGLPGMSGFDLLEHIHRSEGLRDIPVVIHTGRALNHEEEVKLRQYSKSIIIKGAKSQERLLNEVTLFLHMVESELPPEKQKMIRTALAKEAMLDGKKVLIVDDDMRNVFSLSNVLSDKGMSVVEAENGKVALARIEEHPDVDIILMDIMMPEMDGYETIRRLRRDARWKHLPVIAMTAKALKGDQEKCLEAGANDYISKPLDIEKLLSLLRVWLYGHAGMKDIGEQ